MCLKSFYEQAVRDARHQRLPEQRATTAAHKQRDDLRYASSTRRARRSVERSAMPAAARKARSAMTRDAALIAQVRAQWRMRVHYRLIHPHYDVTMSPRDVCRKMRADVYAAYTWRPWQKMSIQPVFERYARYAMREMPARRAHVVANADSALLTDHDAADAPLALLPRLTMFDAFR